MQSTCIHHAISETEHREIALTDCIICGHSLREHYESGCQHHGVLGNGCGCSYVQQPPLPPRALVAEHRTRSDWWDRQARISWDLAGESKDDPDRWYPLMCFYRAARRAELDHRLHADSLVGPAPHAPDEPLPAPVPEYVTVSVEAPQPVLSLAQRLELAQLA